MTLTATEDGIARRLFRSVMRAMVAKDRDNAGGMIALFLEPDVAAQLAIPEGEPAEALHLTLVYLGEDAAQFNADDLASLTAAIGEFTGTLAPLAGEVSGVGRFNGDDQPVVYASVDVPGLVAFRQAIAQIAESAGFAGSPDHDFTPHVTLAYGDLAVPEVPTVPVTFDSVSVVVGGERKDYPLANGPEADAPVAAEKAEWSTAFVNDLPDSSFAIILPGGEKDADGRTTPRSLRKLPYRDASGKVDLPHLRNALARLATADLTPEQRSTAERKLRAAAGANLGKAAEDRYEAVAAYAAEHLLAKDLAAGEAVGVEVAPWEWLRDLSAIVWEVKAEGMPGALVVDDGTDVLSIDDWTVKHLATVNAAERALADPTSAKIERSLRALLRRGRMGGGPRDASLDRAPARKVEAAKDIGYAVVTKAESAHYTLGVAYPARRVGKADSQDVDAHADYMAADELERAAWQFLANGAPDSGMQHKDGTEGAGKVVESYIYRGPTWKVEDQTVEAGDWLLGVVWGDEAWGKIESGDLTGYSMQGYAIREPD